MFARLSVTYGWVWVDERGARGPFIVSDIMRYAGMVTGRAPSGRIAARPLIEYDALSLDGQEWLPVADLRHLIPWEE